MTGYVVKQAVKDRNNQVIGNEILFQRGKESLYNSSEDNQVADTISSFMMQNNEKMYDDKLIFITFTPTLLFKNTPKIFESKKLVIQIEDNVLINPLSQMLVHRYRSEGYHIAINDFQFSPKYFSMLDNADYIKINISEQKKNASTLENIVRMAKGFKKKCVIYGINSKEDYEYAKALDADYMEGAYVSDSMEIKTSKVEFLQGNFFRLVVAVMKDEPDMSEIEEIVSRDAYLTYALLKLVNSRYFTSFKKISSIRQGLVILGIAQLRQWVYLLSLQSTEGQGLDSAMEQVLKLSYLRGTFCSKLSGYVKGFPYTSSDAYIMGMFSTLDYMVDAPIEEILQEIPIEEELKEALIHRTGICGELYSLVLDYEKADWKSINTRVKELGIPSNMVAQFYMDCVEEVNVIWDSITQTAEEL